MSGGRGTRNNSFRTVNIAICYITVVHEGVMLIETQYLNHNMIPLHFKPFSCTCTFKGFRNALPASWQPTIKNTFANRYMYQA